MQRRVLLTYCHQRLGRAVSANVVNHPSLSYYHQRMGAIKDFELTAQIKVRACVRACVRTHVCVDVGVCVCVCVCVCMRVRVL